MKATNSAYLWTISSRSSTLATRPSVPLASPSPRVVTESQTVGRWIEEWLALCAGRGLRPSTVASYRTMLGLHLDDSFRGMTLEAVSASHLNALYGRLLGNGRRNGAGGLSARTVRYLHTIVKRMLGDAVKVGHLQANPATAADPPSPRAARPPVYPVWSPEELARFLTAAREDRLYAAFHLAAATGLRRGEVLGLRWCDIDTDARELRVVQAIVEVAHEPRIGPPKSERSRRVVALDARTAGVLAEHRRVAGASAHLDDHGLMFTAADGTPIHPALFSYAFQRLVRRAGVRRIRHHDLRHTHATHALRAGVHPKVVSERLGHSTVTITLDTYSHLLPSMQREAAEAVAALLPT